MHITAQVGKASADGFTRSNPLGDAEKQKEFNVDDEISVKADGQEAVTYQFNGSEWLPKESSKFLKWESDKMNFTAYYPASFDGNLDKVILPAEYDEASLAANDFMSYYGLQTNTNKSNQLTLTMKRMMARVVVEIAGFNDQYAGATIDKVTSLSICGIKAYKHSDNKFYALIKPCAESSATFISLDVAEGESKTTEKLTGIPKLEAGNSYTYKLTVGKNKVSVSGISVAPWNTGTITDNGKAELYAPYVTFKADGEQMFELIAYGDYSNSRLEYSVNNDKWQEVEAYRLITFGGINGDLRLRGTNTNGTATDDSNYLCFIFFKNNVDVACTGDIRTLLNWRNHKTVETQNARFCNLFENCNVLTSAPELPATTLANDCYRGMFFGCTKLSTVTMLAPSTEIASKSNCFNFWLYNAGTEANSRILKVQDAAAYTALESYLPDNWKKGDTGATVTYKVDEEKNIE